MKHSFVVNHMQKNISAENGAELRKVPTPM